MGEVGAGTLPGQEDGSGGGVRWLPYSSGVRYCRSAVQKWEETTTPARCPKPPSSVMAARARPSPMVEQAPYSPKKGHF